MCGMKSVQPIEVYGLLEYWSDGVMECWSTGVLDLQSIRAFPIITVPGNVYFK